MENVVETETEAKDRLNNWVAISIAILAAFMAVTKVKDDNIVQAMLQAKSDAVDTWGEYQAKRIKEHLLELGREQTITVQFTAPPQVLPRIDEQLKRYETQIANYKDQEAELKKKAQGLEAQYDSLNYRDDQFDLSDACLSVSMALLAVTALTKKKWLLGVSLTSGTFGVIMGIAGLVGWKLHPDWLTKLLS